jgi:hypothetical protein
VTRALHAALCALFVLLVAAYSVPAAADATISAHVEPEIVDELETVRLVIRVSGVTPGSIDVAPLAADFEVLGTQTFNQYRSINGAVESWVEYHIALRPLRAGKLTIPPLAFDDATSKPLTLVVRPVDPALRRAIDRMVFFEIELTRNPVYVRGETVLIRRLFYSDGTQLYSDLPGAPEIPDTRVLPLGETRSDTAVRDGARYGVIEQRFALFPEQPGTVTVPSISLTTSVQLSQQGATRRTGARVSTPPLAIEVRPVPAGWPAQAPWLPATAVTLDDTWTPEGGVLAVGDSVARHVTITVRGNVAAAIAPPADGLPERFFRQYPEPAVLADDRAGNTVTGIRRTTYAIVPTEPGETRLADLEVAWWDVDRDALQVSRIPGRTVVIDGAAPATSPTSTERAVPDSAPALVQATTPEHPARSLTLARILAGIAVGALLTLAVFLFFSRERGRQITRWRAQTVSSWRWTLRRLGLAGDTHGLARIRRLRLLRRALADACERADPAGIERALAAYVSCWYRLPETAALTTFRAAGAGDLLDRLQRARYGRTGNPAPAAGELIDSLRALRRRTADSQSRARRATQTDPLPELYTAR